MTETTQQRRRIMRAVKGKNTGPEMAVRRLVHGMGYRYRLHRKDLPGNPDLVFGPRKKVIFVHGCFWHGHKCKRGDRMPKNNREYWRMKIKRNGVRDREQLKALKVQGWQVLVVWECEMHADDPLRSKIDHFLSAP